MRKIKVFGIVMAVVVIVAVAVGGYILTLHKKPTTPVMKSVSTKTACQLFPLASAKKLLGSDMQASSQNASTEAGIKDAFPGSGTQKQAANAPTGCIYRKATATNPTDITASVGVNTSTPVKAREEFMPAKSNTLTAQTPSSASFTQESISGYGEAAHWAANTSTAPGAYGELTVLSNGSIISIFVKPQDLDLAKKIAKVALSNL